MSADQRPSGGCVNCGAPVRTRKDGEWICAACHKADQKVPGSERLMRAGRAWLKAQDRERQAAAECYAAIVAAVEGGMTEVLAAELAGVNRMTVRRALGKL